MNRYLKSVAVCLLGSTLLLASCGGEEEEGEEAGADVSVTDPETEDDPEIKDEDKVDHRLPTPTRFFEVIAQIGGDLDDGLVNSLDNRDKYTTSASLSLNFGVYFADLAYMNNYGTNSKTLEYFGMLENIANDLSIQAIFSEDIMEKMREGSEDAEAMYAASDEVYFNAYTYLEEEEKSDMLSLMLVGGWVESMYIVTHLVDEYSENNEIINEIAAQRDVLESIFEHVANSSMENDDLLEWIDPLDDLMGIYNESIQNDATTSSKDDSGRLVIGGGDKVVLDELAFGTIVEKIEAMRASIVNPQ